jgi:dipeptidyl-peptidase-4
MHPTILFLTLLLPQLCAAAPLDYPEARALASRTENTIFRAEVRPHWLEDGRKFWYSVNTGPTSREYVLVDSITGTVKRAATLEELSLPTDGRDVDLPVIRATRNTGPKARLRVLNHTKDPVELFWSDFDGQRRSYGRIQAGDDREMETFAGHVWVVVNSLGKPLRAFEAREGTLEVAVDGTGEPPKDPKTEKREDPRLSPDKKWRLEFRDDQPFLVNLDNNEASALELPAGDKTRCSGPVEWSPDSRHVVFMRQHEIPGRKVRIVQSSPSDQLQPKVQTLDYLKPGDELPRPRPVLVQVAERRAMVPDNALFPNPFAEGPDLDVRWSAKGDEFHFNYNQRGHQLYRILAVNAATGAVRTVVEETSKTFIDYTNKTCREWLDGTGELLWTSERDGWCHLWLYDAATGQPKLQVTRGPWVVRKVEHVDAVKRQVWFMAGGVRPEEDPYHLHLCRVNLDGTGFVRLTEGDGTHRITFSPDRACFIDTWSRADQPPVTELRRSADGTLIKELERADISALLATGWTLPERFVAKGRDGKTDIHGIIIKPAGHDAAKAYPVLEEIYAGPHGSFAPKEFGRLLRQQTLAQMGFVIVQADGMGTNHRGKVFHDVSWKNLKDAGFPDRIAWMKAAASTRPWMDLNRVGIYGGSAGGQSAMRALLDHHDFYKAAVADCGCHDNRMDKIWWNEQWLGWPVDDGYKLNSNVEDAGKLQGHLMLVVGELDKNVDPASTMQVANALQRADKDYDLLIMTNTGHGAAETPYASRRRAEFFVRWLGAEKN